MLVNSYRPEIPGASAAVAYQGNRHSKFGLEGGAGVRYYVAERWGIRVEYRYTSSAINFNRILGGVFYQLPDDSFLPFRHGSVHHWRKYLVLFRCTFILIAVSATI